MNFLSLEFALSSSSTSLIIKRELSVLAQQMLGESRKFECLGPEALFFSEIEFLCEQGWAQEAGQTTADCLLVSPSHCDISTVREHLDRLPELQFVLVRAEAGVKKTPCLALLEEFGFSILRERGNTTFLSRIKSEIQVLMPQRRLVDEDITRVLQQSWRRIREIPGETMVDLLLVPASQLLVPDRFDIAIKAMYARLYLAERAQVWRESAYFEHLLRITGPGVTIDEHDGSGKSGIKQFIDAFQRLLSRVEPQSIPPVPVDVSWCAFDGAHRIASAICMHRNVLVARISAPSECRASAEFFSSGSNGHPPCPPIILDEAAIEYCRVKSGLVLALVFPTVASETFAVDQLKKMGKIVHRKEIILSPKAGAALLRQVYLGHSWTEKAEHDSGFEHKVRSCFPFTGTVRAFLLDECAPRDIRPIKECIRSHYGIGNHSLHLTDGDDEVLRIARVIFNENSIELLRNGLGQLKDFHLKLSVYRDWLEEHGLDEESFCIDGSAVLALLGLRECRDLDFLYHGNAMALPAPPNGIDCHNDVVSYHRHSIADLVGDPRLHCWYMGLKFCTPAVVLEMKERRRENKDYADVALLRSRMPTKRSRLGKDVLTRFMQVKITFHVRLARFIDRGKEPLRPLVRTVRRFLRGR